jgi:hypothetical protein
MRLAPLRRVPITLTKAEQHDIQAVIQCRVEKTAGDERKQRVLGR